MTDRMLRTQRLRLRPFRMSDAAVLHPALSDPSVMRYWGNRHRAPSDTEDFVRRTLEADPSTSADFIIERTGEVLGKVGMFEAPEIGYFVLPAHQRQGVATEALRTVLPWIFARFDLPCLTAEVEPRNTVSLHLLGGLGFRETHRKMRTMQIDGQWCDSVFLALDRTSCPPAPSSW